MDNELLQGDKYSLFVPIEDHDLLKSVSIDENGDYIVQGVMTSDDTDEEDDSITPAGMDCSYFLEKGWVKYEHGKNPNQFIGEPLEVKVGRFQHPTLNKSVNGIFVKAKLFASRELTKQAIEAINDLEKSTTKRRMGWSIEGNVIKRHPKTGKVLKSILRNVVLTMNPVNTTTWAELAKSFAKDHELTIDTEEPMDKSMDIASVAEVTPQSLEGASKKKKKKDDPQQAWIDSFRSTVTRALTEKSFKAEFIQSSEDAELLAFGEALSKGLDYEEAEQVSSYIGERHTLLKSLVINFGGENMPAETENMLASLLDADLEELKKSIEADEDDQDFAEDEDEEMEKAIDSEEDDSDESEGDEESDDEGEEDGDEEMEKSMSGSELRKSLSEDHGQAFEVSDFLTAIADEIGYSMEGMEKSIMGVTKTQNTLVKSIMTMGEMMKSLHEDIVAVRAENEELTKSLGAVMNRPVGRKGVVNQRELQTLTKSLDGQGQPKRLSKTQITDELIKSFEAGDIAGSVITRYEGGVPLNQLGLPDHLQKSFGLI